MTPMTALTPQQLREAAGICEAIAQLEELRDKAEDTEVEIALGGRPSAMDPLGQRGGVHATVVHNPAHNTAASGIQFGQFNPPLPQRSVSMSVNVTVYASAIRAKVTETLAPLYARLRTLGLEYKK